MKQLLTFLFLFLYFIPLQAQTYVFKASNGLFGLKNKSGKILSQANYSMIFPFVEGLALAIKEGKYGYLNTSGKEQISFSYDAGWDFQQGLAKVCQGCTFNFDEGEWTGGKWGFINKTGAITVPIRYQEVGSSIKNNLIIVKSNNKFGYVNRQGEEVILPIYEDARSFSEGLASVKKEQKWGFINEQGQTIVEFKYENVGVFSEGLTGVKQNHKWGFIDKSGKEIIKPTYVEVGNFQQGKALVRQGIKFGYIDKSGKSITTPRFDEAWDFQNGVAKVRMGSFANPKYGYINGKGEEVIPIKHDEISNFSSESGIARMRIGNQYGYISNSGKVISPAHFDHAGHFHHHRARVKQNGKWGFINENGETAIPFEYDYVDDFINGIAHAVKDGKSYYIDQNGEIASYRMAQGGKKVFVLDRFDDAGTFSESRLSVKKNNKWGFLNEEGELIIPIEFDKVEDFQNGQALVYQHGDTFYIDMQGQRLEWEFLGPPVDDAKFAEQHQKEKKPMFKVGQSHFDWVDQLKNGLAKVQHEEFWGYIDEQGNIVIPLKYAGIYDFNEDNLAIACKECHHDLGEKDGVLIDTWFDGKWGIVNPQGEEVLAIEYDKILRVDIGIYYVDKDALWGIYNANQKKWIHEPTFNWIEPKEMNGTFIGQSGKWGMLDANYQIVIPCKYNQLYYFGDKHVLATKKDRVGLIDLKGEIVIPFHYEGILGYSEGLFPVKKAGKWGFINKENQAIIPIIYDEVEPFTNGKAQVMLKGDKFYINASGEEIE